MNDHGLAKIYVCKLGGQIIITVKLSLGLELSVLQRRKSMPTWRAHSAVSIKLAGYSLIMLRHVGLRKHVLPNNNIKNIVRPINGGRASRQDAGGYCKCNQLSQNLTMGSGDWIS